MRSPFQKSQECDTFESNMVRRWRKSSHRDVKCNWAGRGSQMERFKRHSSFHKQKAEDFSPDNHKICQESRKLVVQNKQSKTQ